MTAKAIVIGHGDWAEGMVGAAQKIAGQGAAFIALSGKDLSLAQIEELLRDRLEASGVKVIFTDLQAGSSTTAARKVMRNRPDAILVSGSNLPMLLDFALSTESDPIAAAKRAVERGKSCIQTHGGEGSA